MNRFQEHTGVKYPIIQSPMGWIARSQLASAVSNAGGMGIIETSSGDMEGCKAEVAKTHELTSNPFGMNLAIRFLQDPEVVRYVCEESKVKFVITSAGSPRKFVGPLKDAGITVYHSVPTLEMAMKAEDTGVDGLIVEGAEGGGFKNPEEVSTIVLLQAVRERVDLPMVAAGGIVDGRGMASVFALGAEAVQMGTRFVSCTESPVHINFKNAILEAPTTGTQVLNKESSPCLRALKTEFTNELFAQGKIDMSAFGNIRDLYFGGDMEASIPLSGQSAGLIHEVKSAAEIIDDMVAQFHEISGRMGKLSANASF